MSPGLHPILLAGSTFVTGGAERIVYYLARGLDRPPFRVELLALRDLGAIGEEIRDLGIPAHHGLTGSGRIDPLLPLRISRILRRGRHEAIYFLDHPHTVFYTTLASLGAGVRARIVPVHSMGLWGGRPSVRRPIRICLSRIQALVAIAQAQKEYLIREEGLPARKMVVIPNGIAVETPNPQERARRRRMAREELGASDTTPVVGITAVLRPEKNHELLFQAFRRVLRELPEAQLWIVGDGPRRPFLEEEARRLGLAGAARFLGHRPGAKRLMAGMDVAVLSSHPRVETLPLSLLEAMDLALPVVATRVGALGEMVEEGRSGFLTPQGDAQALAAALVLLLKDPQLRARLGERGQEICRERFNVELMIDRTGRLLCDLLGIPREEWDRAPAQAGAARDAPPV